MLFQYGTMAINLVKEADDVDQLTANTITVLFFMHPIVKVIYLAARAKIFYKCLGIWNNPNSHPLFAESNQRYHALAVTKMRQLLFGVCGAIIFSVVCWTGITFMEDPIRTIHDKETNETTIVPVRYICLFSNYFFLFTNAVYISDQNWLIASKIFSPSMANERRLVWIIDHRLFFDRKNQ